MVNLAWRIFLAFGEVLLGQLNMLQAGGGMFSLSRNTNWVFTFDTAEKRDFHFKHFAVS